MEKKSVIVLLTTPEEANKALKIQGKALRLDLTEDDLRDEHFMFSLFRALAGSVIRANGCFNG